MRLFVDQLTNLDFSYLDAQRGVVGETWLANIELEGELDEQGMVCDFGHVKKIIRDWLDENIDHKLLVPTLSTQFSNHTNNKDESFDWRYDNGTLSTHSPKEAHCLVEASEISAKSVALWCIKQLQVLFPKSVRTLSLSFSCEQINGPFYHYTHGLKKHLGNCQRIAHGHRSRIEIHKNGVLDVNLMHAWAQKWQDIYIGTKEDGQEDPRCSDNYLFEYDAQQGRFSISVPKKDCYLIDTESTVELIALHIAQQLKAEDVNSSFSVKAFEGIGKGAIVEV